MLEQIISALVISILAGVTVILYVRDFTVTNDLPLRKITSWLCFAYVAGIALIYSRGQAAASHFFLMLIFIPVLYIAYDFFRRSGFRGSLNLYLVASVLTIFGLLMLFRIGKSANNILSAALMMNGPIPLAFNHLAYCAVGLLGAAWLVSSGRMSWAIDQIDCKTKPWFWALLTFCVLMIPWLLSKAGLGGSSGQTRGWLTASKSAQVSEIAFKLLLCIWMSKFLAARALQMSRLNDAREVLKNVIILGFLIFVVFFVPIAYFQKEIGTCLLIAFSAIGMIYFATGRKYYVLVGLLLIVLAFVGGALVSEHVRERVVGSFLEWDRYAFRTFEGGRSDQFPGFQVFQGLAAVRGAHVWGAGLTHGYTNISKISNDFISAGLLETMGLPALLVLLSCYLFFMKITLSVPLRPDFRGFLTVGIPLIIIIQAFYILSSTLALMPLTGVTLPLVSNGGSSALSTWLLVGVMTEIIGRPQHSRR